jgi:molybdopterin synthase catalytic subunit/molybdopterin synthase sulfur carrier subunit
MTLTVRLFARARDLAGTERIAVDLPATATAGELRRQLAVQIPALSGLIERSALAVAGEFAEDSHLLSPDAEIALLPPVSGG